MNPADLQKLVGQAAGVPAGEVTVKNRDGTQIKANALWEGSCSPTSPRQKVGLFLAQNREDIAAAGAVRRLSLELPFPEAMLVIGDPNGTDQRANVIGYEDSLTAKSLAEALGVAAEFVPRPVFKTTDWHPPTVGAEILEANLKETPNIVLQGPPGTGKSSIALELIRQRSETGGMTPAECRLGRMVDEKGGDIQLLFADTATCKTPPIIWEFVQLHPGYSYDDLVRRVVPVNREDGQIQLSVEDGLLPQLCRLASLREGPVVLILDEINRGNLAAILGEFVFAIDPGHRGSEVRLQYQGSGLSSTISVPPNLWIIGTMNTADRSIAMVDYAVRRRFRFIDVPASVEALQAWYVDDPAKRAVVSDLFQLINSGLPERLKIGHAALLEAPVPPETWPERMARRIAYQVFPILLEYEKEGLRDSSSFSYRNETFSMGDQRRASASIASSIKVALAE